MFKKLICLTLMLFSGVTFANVIIPKVSEGHLDVKKNFSSKYVESRFLNIWLPPGYSNTRKYDVLYMHDGRMLFDAKTTWNKQEWQVDEVAAKLIQSGKVKPFIVVGIPNALENRHSEYFPQKVFESLAKQKQADLFELERYPGQKLFYSKVYSDNYARFVVEEVIPFIEDNYSVNKGFEHRYIAGSSMGGLISWYTLLQYPNEFAGAICMSTHWPGIFTYDKQVFTAFKQYISDNIGKLTTQKVYFDYGDGTLDSMYPDLQKQIDNVFMQHGYPASLWQSQYFPGATHAEVDWAKRLQIPLEFMFRANAQAL
ncbi:MULTISPECIES: alpha/beta hydrolase [Pseudoalteromonas]|nr:MULTISPECIES: alpha/beta hydrolase-fold protein [Pseudoalteromonas]MCF2915018.1 alpha/beta hydrolase [Pseudoalteromonas sp. Cn5-37]